MSVISGSTTSNCRNRATSRGKHRGSYSKGALFSSKSPPQFGYFSLQFIGPALAHAASASAPPLPLPHVIFPSAGIHFEDLLPQIRKPLLFFRLSHVDPILETSNVFFQLSLPSDQLLLLFPLSSSCPKLCTRCSWRESCS